MEDIFIIENNEKQKKIEILENLGLLWLLLIPFIYYFIGLKNLPIPIIAIIELAYIFILLAEIYLQRDNFANNNIDKLSLILLLVLGCLSNSHAPIIQNYIINITYLGALILFFVWPKLLQNSKTTISPYKGFSLMFVGFWIGVFISITKILLNDKIDWLISAKDNPVVLFTAIIFSFTTVICRAEFIYRGFLWRTLKRMRFKTPIIILTTTLLWTFSIPSIWNNIPEMINITTIGILLGICTWKTKTISMNIGILAGYSVLLIYSYLPSYTF